MSLMNVKVGDELFVVRPARRHGSPHRESRMIVTKVARKYLSADNPNGFPCNVQFERESGRAKAKFKPSTAYVSDTEYRAIVAREQQCHAIANKFRSYGRLMRWERLTDDELETLGGLMTKLTASGGDA